MKWNRFIASQFGKPSGISGIVATFIMNRMNGKLYRFVEDKLSLKPGEKVLDIGFGNGSFIRRLSGIGNGNKIYGIDISEDMLKVAVKKNRDAVLQGRI
ncbi:MAG: class I SAM-dependent methyltransferase [Barnesiella sp.]